MRSVTVGILGLGNVGAGTVRLLHERRAAIEARLGAVIEVRRICVRDPGRRRAVDVAPELITADPRALIADPMIDVVVELIGGVEPACSYILAALRAGVARVCLTSSFSTVGFHADDPSRPCAEELPFFPFIDWMPYSRTKVLAEIEAFKAIADGLDVVIAISTGVCGPHDFLPSRTGNALLSYARGKFRAYIPGGYEAVGVDDLARGHVLAMERGRKGQRYTISSRYVTMDEMLDLFAEVTGKPRKARALPPKLMAGVARAVSGAMTAFFPDVPQHLTPGAVLVLSMQRRADIGKARAQLGYEPTAIEPVVRAWYEFFVREQMV